MAHEEVKQECRPTNKTEDEEEEEPHWSIRLMKHEDIDKCLFIWSQVELTEAYDTVASTLSADPAGFYVAELCNNRSDKNGDGTQRAEVIGMCAGPMTRTDTAFMGFYAVDPKYQRLGIGRKLWEKTIGRLDESINVGLYGVPSMSEKYKKSGFMIEDTTRMLIFESQRNAQNQLKLDSLKSIDDFAPSCRLEIIDSGTSEELFKKLIDYDQSLQKFSRELLLRLYMRGKKAPLTVAIVKKEHHHYSSSVVGGGSMGVIQQLQSSTGSGAVGVVCSSGSYIDQHHPILVGAHHQPSGLIGERKSSCCAKPSQESIIEDEALSTNVKSISLSSSHLPGECVAVKCSSPIDIPSIVSSSSGSITLSSSASDHPSHHLINSTNTTTTTTTITTEEILGYGCIRLDNNGGGMIGPIYADSSDLCEVILRKLMKTFKLSAANIYSVMALSSNKQACKILTKIGLHEVEQCSRMFTKFVPTASFSKIYYVHSPNFTLF